MLIFGDNKNQKRYEMLGKMAVANQGRSYIDTKSLGLGQTEHRIVQQTWQQAGTPDMVDLAYQRFLRENQFKNGFKIVSTSQASVPTGVNLVVTYEVMT